MNPRTKLYLGRIIPFASFWLLFGIVYALLEKGLLGNSAFYPSTNNPYDFTSNFLFASVGAMLMGLCLGFIEVYFLGKKLIGLSFFWKILIKTIFYLCAIVFFLITIGLLGNSIRLDKPIFDPAVAQTVIDFIKNFAFFSVIIFIGVMVILSLFVSELTNYIGQNVFKNFFTGKYNSPQIEERIFMFLDIRSSTRIAEKLGHVRYFKLLNSYYKDISNAIVDSYGQIYQYVGDEVIITWNLNDGIRENQCVACFFRAKNAIEDLSDKYIEEFGLVPEFKAGVHCGQVTTGEIGVIKKELVFTGDVLNTAARLQNQCNHFKVDILLSSELTKHLSLNNDFSVTEIGEYELRGREAKIQLYTVTEL